MGNIGAPEIVLLLLVALLLFAKPQFPSLIPQRMEHGWRLGSVAFRAGWLRSLPIFLATEIVLLFWIRDSLILEIIMLLHPFDSIKKWQLGH